MIGKFYGKNISLQVARDKSQIGRGGVNLLGISEAAESFGFRSNAILLSFESLVNEAVLPAIIVWDQNHFIVLVKISKNRIYVADPLRGYYKLSNTDFLSHWVKDKSNQRQEGIALLLEPGPEFYNNAEENDENRVTNYKKILSYLVPYKKLIFQLIIGLLLSSLLQLVVPFLTQSIVDTGINSKNLQFIYIILFAQIALFVGRLVVEFVRGWIMLHISSRINISILTDFLIKLMKLPLSFFDSRNTGDILQRMGDHNRIESFLTGTSLSTVFSVISFVIFSILLAFFNFYVFIIFIISSILYSMWVMLFLRARARLDSKRFVIAGMEQGAKIQLIQSMQEIKLNGIEAHMRWLWENLQAKLYKISLKVLALNQWQQSGAGFIIEGKNIIITFISAKAVIDSQMTLGTMLAVQYMIGQLNSPMEQLVSFLQSWQNAKMSMERLNEIHSLENEEVNDKEYIYHLPKEFSRKIFASKGNSYNSEAEYRQFNDNSYKFSPNLYESRLDSILKQQSLSNINFTNVSFAYTGAGNETVLRNINVSIPKGKTTAIVGISGSGKTTLLKLLLKFYEPQRGEIKLGNTSLSSISHKYWRSHCGVVMQESYIFSDTIARNIALGQGKIDVDKLWKAIEIANLKDFIESLPLSFNTKIGTEGTGISMGQKQRILIARVVYRDPEFIFFDEATNSLDANNESVIIENLNSFFTGKTVIIIAHRLSTVKNANQIIVLKNGEIVEKGNHSELINLKEDYYTLVKNQLELEN